MGVYPIGSLPFKYSHFHPFSTSMIIEEREMIPPFHITWKKIMVRTQAIFPLHCAPGLFFQTWAWMYMSIQRRVWGENDDHSSFIVL